MIIYIRHSNNSTSFPHCNKQVAINYTFLNVFLAQVCLFGLGLFVAY